MVVVWIINNSNKYSLKALLKDSYIDSTYLGNLKDSKEKVIKSLSKNLKKYDVLITTGGASVGEEDHIINVMKEEGEVFFWKTAIKPGRPLAVGQINKTIIVCLHLSTSIRPSDITFPSSSVIVLAKSSFLASINSAAFIKKVYLS